MKLNIDDMDKVEVSRTIANDGEIIKAVKTFRCDPDVWDKADAAARRKHGKSIRSVIEPLMIAYFGLDKK